MPKRKRSVKALAPPIDSFHTYMRPILVLEGDGILTNDSNDNGHQTIWGITEVTARAAGYTGVMADMIQAVALNIYRPIYWVAPGFDKIDLILPALGQYLLQVGINLGPSVPSIFVQRALNVLSNEGTLYSVLKVDGVLGKRTRLALSEYRSVRTAAENGDMVLMAMLRAQTIMRYVEIAENSPDQQRYVFGWISKRAMG